MAERKCSVCGNRIASPTTSGLVKKHLARISVREAHCSNDQCTWCRMCVVERVLAGQERDARGGQ